VSQDFPSIQQTDVNVDKKTVTLDHDRHFDLPAWTKAVEDLNETYHVRTLS